MFEIIMQVCIDFWLVYAFRKGFGGKFCPEFGFTIKVLNVHTMYPRKTMLGVIFIKYLGRDSGHI